MSKTNDIIISMITENCTANEIIKATDLTHKQLFYRLNMLKTKGYNFKEKYYSNGEISYKIDKTITTEPYKGVTLFTSHKERKLTAILMSDLHICNEHDRLDLLYNLYNFCIKENIKIILNGGDLIDGLFGPSQKKFSSYEEQINYFLKVYPFDQNIINFVCLGNHDLDALKTRGQDLKSVLNIKRHDIVPIGYGTGIINIKNDSIVMIHPKTPSSNEIENMANKLILCGHYHKMETSITNNNVNIYIPSLSDIGVKEYGCLPGAVKMTIEFSDNGLFKTGIFEQYVFVDKMYKVGEHHYDLSMNRDLKTSGPTKYEEELPPIDKKMSKVKK